ncbi:hypothetical protein FHX81_3087 [Saccharothrix saharensis]|uniref:Uncharacterized protein n=1 Tax=Saccharothrix saharensis TaxID=571190 RepID=A0A543JD55_9PSEU|nr:hypothetical protein [Saccharothrix saharensis]TQM80740.1 hypothetical protein FHX81_3087 [Saccharothrix saharensis]
MRIIPAALVAVAAAALLALGAGSAAADQATPDHTVAVASTNVDDNRDM